MITTLNTPASRGMEALRGLRNAATAASRLGLGGTLPREANAVAMALARAVAANRPGEAAALAREADRALAALQALLRAHVESELFSAHGEIAA